VRGGSEMFLETLRFFYNFKAETTSVCILCMNINDAS
jgi:hypothetical protein